MTSWERADPIAGTRADFLRRTEGLAIGTRASEGVFIGDRFMHSDGYFRKRGDSCRLDRSD